MKDEIREDGALVDVERIGLFLDALKRIAKGRCDCGRPMAAEEARQLARETLIEGGVSWK
jgi:hypothetical protein